MRFVRFFVLITLSLGLWSQMALAQGLRITAPQPNEDIRGEYTVRFEGLPQGGYAMVKIDGAFYGATGQSVLTLDTIADRTTFTRGDGAYKLTLTAFNSGGKRTGEAEVTFNVANGKVQTDAQSVQLVAWKRPDRLDPNVQRYRVFGESNAIIDKGEAAGGGGAGAGQGSTTYIEAPLDFQFSALMRRIVRDIDMYSDDPQNRSANLRTVVQEAFVRGRLKDPPEVKGRPKKGPSVAIKGPWGEWVRARETGQYFVKMAMPSGVEINATRKPVTIAMADLLPTFPETPVRPGSTWETTMTMLGELAERQPVNVRSPITFTAFESLLTPANDNRRCSKLEARFRYPGTIEFSIASRLASQIDGGGGEEAEWYPEDFLVIRSNVARVLWFDIDRSRVLRSEDTLRLYFEYLKETGAQTPAGTASPAGDAGGAQGGAKPTKVTYNLTVTTWLDDRIPDPTTRYNGGAGTAHARDSVTDPTIARVNERSGPGSPDR